MTENAVKARLYRVPFRAWRVVARVSRAAGHARHEVLRRRDLEMLGWLAEQYGARADQLEVLMGCGPRTVQRTVARLRAQGLVRSERMIVGEPASRILRTTWPASAALRAKRSSFATTRPPVSLRRTRSYACWNAGRTIVPPD
jgi:hypothetical protein